MTYVIAAPCVADFACVDVCPVNCISPLPSEAAFDDTDQLYINPAICVNCGACRDVCPVLAIFEAEDLPARWQHYEVINRAYFNAAASE